MEPIVIPRLAYGEADFEQQLQQRLAWESVSDAEVAATVRQILDDVRQHGDKALLSYTNQFDRRDVKTAQGLQIDACELDRALASIPAAQRQALEEAAQRIDAYHQQQKQQSWQYRESDGTVLGQQITPLDKVGIYVPGGKASYPSSVLMNAIPAKVAGVNDIVMAVPSPDNNLNALVLAAASIAGVNSVFSIGGAQAIAALAYGTESVPRVDKIVGPGNIYVATAKRAVFGEVGLDMVAGPSEILIYCDGKTPADWIAMDLFSQAEHDENAQSMLISTDSNFLDAVEQSIATLLPQMERAGIIRQALQNRGLMIKVDNDEQALAVINRIAPEHLELSVENADDLLPNVRHAGAIFLGRYTAEALGDYCAGPNHVLPTSATARFSSPLGVYDFQKRSSIIKCSPEGAAKLMATASTLARGEGLTAHARSAEMRAENCDGQEQ